MNYSLYFHVPFCKRRCHYCDFYTTTGNEGLISAYIDGLIKEFRIVSERSKGVPVHSVYFGGGTPSIISAKAYETLITEIASVFDLSPDCEISLEANPGTLSKTYLRDLFSLGFNRISLGVQSTDSFDLIRLDRIHTVEDVLISLKNARQVGFNNISLDLIFGLPWQNFSRWENSLERAIQLDPQHFSIYSLIIEPGTPLNQWYQRGLIARQDPDLEGEMYAYTIARLRDAGYVHYEISNWNKRNPEKDYRCRHNLQYWRNKPYYGFGASAHGYVNYIRTENTSSLFSYLERLNKGGSDTDYPGSPATIMMNAVDKATQMKDFMMLGLRLIQEGVSEKRFQDMYNISMRQVFEQEISFLIDHQLVEWESRSQERLRLTPRGVMIANQVFMQFV